MGAPSPVRPCEICDVVMKTLRVTSFGIRGFVGESLTPRVLIDFASAFATFVEGGRVLIGRDTRYSSQMIHSAVVSGLLSAGCEVIDFGICPTPIVQFSVVPMKAAGAISISGGHNPMGWNALMLIGADGSFLSPLGGETVLDVFHAGDFRKADWQHMGSVQNASDFSAPYFEALEKHINVPAIRKAGLTVLIDPVGGAGCSFLESFATRFGFSLVPVNAQPSGYLAREAEPRPRSALQMASIIKRLGGHVGFVLSSDMGRLSLVTEDGEPASEEYTFAVIADHILGKRTGTIVTNCCTTRTIDDIARSRKATVVKTPVGQAFVVSALMDEQGILGGEGSGSVALPAFSRAFDGFLMMVLVLEAMAEKGKPLSELIKGLPRYHIVKKRVLCDSRKGYHALEILRDRLVNQAGGRVDHTDGMRVDWDDGWVHARASQTEQMIRVISEAKNRAVAEQRADDITRIIEQEV
jgi:phosphomannomutase